MDLVWILNGYNPGTVFRKLASRISAPPGENFTYVSCRYGSRYGFILKWVWIQGADSMRALMGYGFRVWIYRGQVWISVKRHTIFIKRYGFGCRLIKFKEPYNLESAIYIIVISIITTIIKTIIIYNNM